MIIRKINKKDNAKIEEIIKSTFIEYELPRIGTAYQDKETTKMFQAYQNENDVYFVIEEDGEVVGGAGVKNLGKEICELQKMYFDKTIRGKGYGKLLITKCLETAKELGDKKCYLETISTLQAAIHIYEKHGFKHLKKPLGNTDHYSCDTWMIKEL